jgi:hypothetical protein
MSRKRKAGISNEEILHCLLEEEMSDISFEAPSEDEEEEDDETVEQVYELDVEVVYLPAPPTVRSLSHFSVC